MGSKKPPIVDILSTYVNKTLLGRPLKEDLTGKKFGKLTVERYLGRTAWLVTCECNTSESFSVLRRNLVSGHTESCGCKRYPQRIELQKEYAEDLKKNIKYNFWSQLRRHKNVYTGLCLCGKRFTKRSKNPHSILSCGCIGPEKGALPKDIFNTFKTKHEMNTTWTKIRERSKRLRTSMDPLWAQDFVWFLGWAISQPNFGEVFDPDYNGKKYVLRKDCNKGYTPENSFLSRAGGIAGRRQTIVHRS